MTSSNQPLAAIIGTGLIAASHVKALRENGIPILCAVSRTKSGAQAFAQQWNIPLFGDDLSLAFDPRVTCVHVCTPPALHYSMVRTLLEHGKHIICEKPLCLNSREAHELVHIAEERHLLCAVDFNVRFHPACIAAKKAVENQDFGPVRLIHGNYLQEFGALPAFMDWRYIRETAGELHAVTEIGSHWLDIAQYISGKKIEAVSAQFDHFHQTRYLENGLLYAEDSQNRQKVAVPSEDVAIINLRFSDNAIGVVTLSEMSQGHYNHLMIEVTGDHGNLWWNSEQALTLCHAEKGKPVQSEIFAFDNGFSGTFTALIAEVYNAILADVSAPPSYPTCSDGAEIVDITEAIATSAHHNAVWVNVHHDS